jgi:hypothetical protein
MAEPRKPADRRPKASTAPEPVPVKSLVVQGRAYVIPGQDHLTWGEVEDIEDAFGREFESLSRSRQVIAGLWVAMRREVPSVTLDDVRALTIGSVTPGEVDDDPPAPAA